jgi:hypothetical protein
MYLLPKFHQHRMQNYLDMATRRCRDPPKTSTPPSGPKFGDNQTKFCENVKVTYMYQPTKFGVNSLHRSAPGAWGSLSKTRSRDLLTLLTHSPNCNFNKSSHRQDLITPLPKKHFSWFLGTIGACREVRPTRASNFCARHLAAKLCTGASGRLNSPVGQLETMFSQNLTAVGPGVRDLWAPEILAVFHE